MAQLLLTAASAGAGVVSAGLGAVLTRTAAATAAAYAAGYADRLIFGPRKRAVEGPRLETLAVQASQEGAPLPRVYGRARIAGQLIWAANFREEISQTTEASGGKGARPATRTTYTEYLYSASFAVGLCEGEISRIGRVWADGKAFDMSAHNVRIYRGSADQPPDGLIEGVEGVAPAYRGTAYVVFEDLPLKDFGNRIPQLSFEVEKSLKDADPDALENRLTAVTMIPGSGEFVYGTTQVLRETGEGAAAPENAHAAASATDFTLSLEALCETAPALAHVSLVVSWFGDGLDAGACRLRPGVDSAEKTTTPYDWRVGGTTREGAHLVSRLDGAPAYGGTPADRAVLEGIAALKAKGLAVMLHPFLLMDAPGFPWRGRINAGAADRTPAAADAVAAFFGTARAADFSFADGAVLYSGPDEWSFRRMILHYATLCAGAGGVDAFLLGSELRGLTTIRDGAGAYPAVAALVALAAEVRAILGPETEISYGADWSEYFGHQPADGSGDVFFHLDDLWADGNIDFIGVDNYLPLADWRDGFAHLDAQAGAGGPHDRDYLETNIRGGEGYDWHYASADDRTHQIRTPIADGAYGEPWIYRPKDFRNWWSRPHYNRPGGVRADAPTAWVPESKPIVFTEIGAPAVDKAANQPNVFIDPKSDESAVPHFSTGRRDDLAQRRFLEAHARFWRAPANNPVSSLTGAPMVDAARSFVYAYDARPYPDFPARADVWGDGANWATGHWLNGRLGRAPLDVLVRALGAPAGDGLVEAAGLAGDVAGYVVDRPMSPREAIDPLADVFQFDMVETDGRVRCQGRAGAPVLALAAGDLADEGGAPFRLTLEDARDLPDAVRLSYADEGADYEAGVAEARAPRAGAPREAGVDIAATMAPGEAEARARAILADAGVMRERLSLALAPSRLALEPGDAVTLADLGTDRLYRVCDIEDGPLRRCDLVRVVPSVYAAPAGPVRFRTPPAARAFGAPAWALFELPALDGAEPGAPWFAAFADPWPGRVALYREAGAPALAALAPARAVMGRLAADLAPAGTGRWTRGCVDIALSFGAVASRTDDEVLAGANRLAVESATGRYELLQFRNADLLETGLWRLTGLLRGQGGGEAEARAGAPAGARVVLMTGAVVQGAFPTDLRGLALDWQAGPATDIPDTAAFSRRTLTVNGRGLAPLAPVHLRAARDGADLRLSWIRRTREGGDGWVGEVPLAEREERYRVTIFNGAAPVREVETDAPAFRYAGADIAADFGPEGPGASILFAVAQRSDAVGPGEAARAAVFIT